MLKGVGLVVVRMPAILIRSNFQAEFSLVKNRIPGAPEQCIAVTIRTLLDSWVPSHRLGDPIRNRVAYQKLLWPKTPSAPPRRDKHPLASHHVFTDASTSGVAAGAVFQGDSDSQRQDTFNFEFSRFQYSLALSAVQNLSLWLVRSNPTRAV